jgi:hypothetical protein
MLSTARIAFLTALTALVGCGPNYRYVYDGESAFERCYGLDYDSAVIDTARVSCWSSWLQSYSYGANPDRVDFARNRLAAIGTGDRPNPGQSSSGANAASLNPSANAALPGAPTTPTAASLVPPHAPKWQPRRPPQARGAGESRRAATRSTRRRRRSGTAPALSHRVQAVGTTAVARGAPAPGIARDRMRPASLEATRPTGNVCEDVSEGEDGGASG